MRLCVGWNKSSIVVNWKNRVVWDGKWRAKWYENGSLAGPLKVLHL